MCLIFYNKYSGSEFPIVFLVQGKKWMTVYNNNIASRAEQYYDIISSIDNIWAISSFVW